MAEVRWGFVVLAVLAAIAGWVAWRGAHPDPALFAAGPLPRGQGGKGPAAARGALPDKLAAEGWSEASLAHFDADNLYVKINGRADYYKSFGFRRLTFVTLLRDDDPNTSVDIEFYDLRSAGNALGAYGGERPPGVSPEVGEAGLGHLARNALLMTRGRYYIRAIGSDETPVIRAQLEKIRARMAALAGEPLPWGYALLSGRLGFSAERVRYLAKNAFSFGFAHDLFVATLDDGEAELFISARADAGAAQQLAGRFAEGFASLGERVSGSDETTWIKDRYQGKVSGAVALERWVVGVRNAADLDGARRALQRIRDAVDQMPADLRQRARPGANVGAAADDDGDREY
jgi:hypothetical protein